MINRPETVDARLHLDPVGRQRLSATNRFVMRKVMHHVICKSRLYQLGVGCVTAMVVFLNCFNIGVIWRHGCYFLHVQGQKFIRDDSRRRRLWEWLAPLVRSGTIPATESAASLPRTVLGASAR